MLNCLAHDFLKPKYYLYKKFSKKFKNTGAVCSAVPAAVGILRKMPRFPSQSRLQKARRRRQANGKTLPILPISKPSRIPMPPRRSCGRNTRRLSPAPKSKVFPLPPEPIACPRMSLPFWQS